jgi:hypothetical protein
MESSVPVLRLEDVLTFVSTIRQEHIAIDIESGRGANWIPSQPGCSDEIMKLYQQVNLVPRHRAFVDTLIDVLEHEYGVRLNRVRTEQMDSRFIETEIEVAQEYSNRSRSASFLEANYMNTQVGTPILLVETDHLPTQFKNVIYTYNVIILTHYI